MLALIALLASLGAQAPSNAAADSARRAVQKFYDWYTPRSAKPRGRDMVMLAATHGPLAFDKELVRWLRIDSTARAKAKDEVDGLDGDPYFNSQDPCAHYTARAAHAQGATVRVDVVGAGRCEKRALPDVVVELVNRNGTWTVVELHDPSRHDEGLIPLLKQLHPKAH